MNFKHVLLVVVVVFCASNGMSMDDLSIEEYCAYVNTTLHDVSNFELQYKGSMSVLPSTLSSGLSADYYDKQINDLKDYLERRKEGCLTAKEEAADTTSENQLLTSIETMERLKSGANIESFYVFSTDGKKHRTDIFRSNDATGHHYYLFDGQKGYTIFPEKKDINSAPSFTKRWKNPANCNGYGFNLINFLHDGYSVRSIDSQQNKITVDSVYHKNSAFVFDLLEDSPAYWTKMTQLDNDGLILREVECSDFSSCWDILIPKTIVIRRRNIKGDLYDHITLSLVNSNVNDAEFPSTFFSLPEENNYIVKNYNR